jgi:DNA-nicking Smr family endonuclease
MTKIPQQALSFEDALSESLGDVTAITADDTATLSNISARRDTAMLDKQLRRAAISDAVKDESNPLSLSLRSAVLPDDMLIFKRPGIQDGVFKNLRLGKYSIEGVINLQGLRMNDSRSTLYKNLINCREQGIRTVLIKHGRGVQSLPIPALTKSYVAQWLIELDEVIAFHSAQRQHGGLAATYALLKKHPNQKLINRERLYKRC